MKTAILAAFLLGMNVLFPASVIAADACEAVLCLYGKTTGNSGGHTCQSAERAFFSIVKKNRHGFLPGQTADARQAFLNECDSADQEIIDQIISKFGRVRN
ncbi:TrbM/KikA/MpfK family conjugal transfer protein [Dickeya dadantii]|uniref:TrbM/KikA/MpfK family conjugal transfer protein n=1 Tax=Dickeya dadantii TaxID=204038 RepID=UPI0021D9C104|nr:TrbM/KikA/MpfK family conjugal transfer protein [Dickeya dadantii]